ncbi:MAG: hypothetical protein DRH37_03865 [Deltaproteobacteria bacterium]|nr:MAG: hypothetical protein DRH37_03865 [Deltaproteobacteria bacterium]
MPARTAMNITDMKNIIDLNRYRKVKADYQKLLERNPHPFLTFKDYVKVRDFLEKVQKAKLQKTEGKRDE